MPGRSTLWAVMVLLVVACVPRAGRSQVAWVGLGGGLGVPHGQTHSPGLWLEATAAVDRQLGGEHAMGMAVVRGTLAGYIRGERSWAAMPLLTGDAGLRLGPASVFLVGGFQTMGGAAREGWTVFSTFGLVGGAGASLTIDETTRLSLRAQAIWLPDFTTGVVSRPDAKDDAGRPEFIFYSISMLFEFRQGTAEAYASDWGW